MSSIVERLNVYADQLQRGNMRLQQVISNMISDRETSEQERSLVSLENSEYAFTSTLQGSDTQIPAESYTIGTDSISDDQQEARDYSYVSARRRGRSHDRITAMALAEMARDSQPSQEVIDRIYYEGTVHHFGEEPDWSQIEDNSIVYVQSENTTYYIGPNSHRVALTNERNPLVADAEDAPTWTDMADQEAFNTFNTNREYVMYTGRRGYEQFHQAMTDYTDFTYNRATSTKVQMFKEMINYKIMKQMLIYDINSIPEISDTSLEEVLELYKKEDIVLWDSQGERKGQKPIVINVDDIAIELVNVAKFKDLTELADFIARKIIKECNLEPLDK